MALRSFIKQNFVLTIGLALPILLIVLFFLASVVPKAMAKPPQYEMLFSTSRYEGQTGSRPSVTGYVVRDGLLRARVSKSDGKNYNYYARKLMAYDGKTDSIREISLDIAKSGNAADGDEIIPDETRNLKIDPSSVAPDGYVFEGISYGSGGLVMELFSAGYRGQAYRIKKGAVVYKLPNPVSNYYYNDVQFIGWIVDKH